jgi:hypothetical protein
MSKSYLPDFAHENLMRHLTDAYGRDIARDVVRCLETMAKRRLLALPPSDPYCALGEIAGLMANMAANAEESGLLAA